MLKTGLVTSIYDHISFPSPAGEQAEWEVEDENTGKMVAIPRPVAEIRVWDPEEKKYGFPAKKYIYFSTLFAISSWIFAQSSPPLICKCVRAALASGRIRCLFWFGRHIRQ